MDAYLRWVDQLASLKQCLPVDESLALLGQTAGVGLKVRNFQRLTGKSEDDYSLRSFPDVLRPPWRGHPVWQEVLLS